MKSSERRQERDNHQQNQANGRYHNNAQSLPDNVSSLKFIDVLLLQLDGFLLLLQRELVILNVLSLQIANFR